MTQHAFRTKCWKIRHAAPIVKKRKCLRTWSNSGHQMRLQKQLYIMNGSKVVEVNKTHEKWHIYKTSNIWMLKSQNTKIKSKWVITTANSTKAMRVE